MSTTKEQHSHMKEESHEDDTLQALIKAESGPDDSDDLMGNVDDEDDGDGYRPRPQLPRPQVNLRSLADLIRCLDDGSIDVNPEYQREVVWTADRMTGLVNSLMENFYIPPIILNGKQIRVVEGGKPGTRTTYVCVDGKQRLSSVRAFIKGMIPCHDHRGENWWFSNEAGRRRRILSDAVQRAFLNKDFVTYQFNGLSQEQEEDLFARVQMGMTLTAAEKMRASSGPWQELARLFVDDFPAVYNLMKDRARAKDFQLTLSCFSQIVEIMHPTAATGIPVLKTNHTALPKFIGNKGLVDDGIKSHLASVWNTLQELIELDPDTFTNASKYLGGVQTFAPVEMVAVTIMISMYSETRNNRMLLGDIRALREELRKHFIDLRLNAATWKFIWEYLDELEVIRGAVDGSVLDRTRFDSASRSSSTAAPIPYDSASAVVRSSQAKSAARRGDVTILPPPNARPSAASGANLAFPEDSTKETSPQIVNVNIDPEAATLPSQTRFLKRQRTGSRPSALPQTASSTSFEQTLFVPEGTGENTAVLRQRHINHPKAPVQQGAFDAQKAQVPSNHYPRQQPQEKPPFLSPKVRPGWVSQLHEYCPSPSTHPENGYLESSGTSPQLPSRTVSSPDLSISPYIHQLNISGPHYRTGIGAYTPRSIHEQGEGIIRSISPQVPLSVLPATPSAQPQIQKKRKHITRSIPTQRGETIDLTYDSDCEQEEQVERERQSLLSSFKGKSTTAKQAYAPAISTATQPSATPQGSLLVGVGATTGDACAEFNNPYAEYKNQDRGHL